MARAQDRDWSLEVHYPISLGDNFSSSNEGLLGVGAQYRFAHWGKARLGVELNASWFATTFINDSDPIQEEKFRDFFLQARMFYDAPLTANEKLRFRGALGWAYQRATGPVAFFDEQGRIQGNDEYHGPVLSAGLTYDITPRWYLSGSFDMLFQFNESENRTVGLSKIGVGFRF